MSVRWNYRLKSGILSGLGIRHSSFVLRHFLRPGVFVVAVLRVIKGSSPGQLVELHGERMVMGRHPHCHIVLDNAAVSRNHAQILESHGSYYVEDLRSRNGTLVNGQRIRGRTELKDGDQVKVCDLIFSFHYGAPPELETPTPPFIPRAGDRGKVGAQSMLATVTDESFLDLPETPARLVDEPPSDKSSIITTLDVPSSKHPRITVRPDVKLRAVMDISRDLAKTLDFDSVLPKILESLFNIFPQADRGFVVLKDGDSNQLAVKAMRNRREDDDAQAARVSTTILKEAMRDGRAILSADASSDKRFHHSDSIASMQIRSVMCVPLVTQAGDALGVIQIDTRDMKQQFSQDDLDLLTSVAAQAALAIENASLHSSLLKQHDLDRELEFATQVQLGFLPTERPRLNGYQFYDFYEAAYRVGGDFFDYVLLPDGRVAIGLGDVAGKGVPAALLMARVYSAARYELIAKPTVAEAMCGLNSGISSSGLGHRFVTFVCAVLDPKTHELTMVNAGHLPPLLRDAKGKVIKIACDDSGLPLGVKQDYEYHQSTIRLASGDTVVMFTDGVTEAMNLENEIYGMKRLTAFLKQAPDDVEPLGENLVEDVEKFGAGRSQRDDVCLICFRRMPE